MGERRDYSWSDAYVSGIEAVDMQHRVLIKMLALLVRAQTEGGNPELVSDVLTVMTDYANKHLRFEEELMRKHEYPEAEAHIKHHKEFRRRTSELCYMEGCLSSKMGDSQINRLIAFLEHWLPGHIVEEDIKLGQYLLQAKVEPASLRNPSVSAWVINY